MENISIASAVATSSFGFLLKLPSIAEILEMLLCCRTALWMVPAVTLVTARQRVAHARSIQARQSQALQERTWLVGVGVTVASGRQSMRALES